MGECPDWYLHLLAARHLGVPPWELPEDSPWKDVVIAAMNAEAHARDMHQQNRR